MGKKYFTDSDQEIVVNAIKQAELATSGEIRVHVETTCKKDPLDRAKEVFFALKMDATEQRNGVLIYLALDSRKLAICGDSGIHDKVGDSFWQAEKDLMQDHFSRGDYARGLALAIEKVGEKLKTYFPYSQSDLNELNNEMSFGE